MYPCFITVLSIVDKKPKMIFPATTRHIRKCYTPLYTQNHTSWIQHDSSQNIKPSSISGMVRFLPPLFAWSIQKPENAVGPRSVSHFSSFLALLCAGGLSFVVYHIEQDENAKRGFNNMYREEEVIEVGGTTNAAIVNIRINTNSIGNADLNTYLHFRILWTNVRRRFFRKRYSHQSDRRAQQREFWRTGALEDHISTTTFFTLPTELQIKKEISGRHRWSFLPKRAIQQCFALPRQNHQQNQKLFQHAKKKKITHIGISGNQIRIRAKEPEKQDNLEVFHYKKWTYNDVISLKKGCCWEYKEKVLLCRENTFTTTTKSLLLT